MLKCFFFGFVCRKSRPLSNWRQKIWARMSLWNFTLAALGKLMGSLVIVSEWDCLIHFYHKTEKKGHKVKDQQSVCMCVNFSVCVCVCVCMCVSAWAHARMWVPLYTIGSKCCSMVYVVCYLFVYSLFCKCLCIIYSVQSATACVPCCIFHYCLLHFPMYIAQYVFTHVCLLQTRQKADWYVWRTEDWRKCESSFYLSSVIVATFSAVLFLMCRVQVIQHMLEFWHSAHWLWEVSGINIVLIYMSNISVDLCNELCSSGHPAGSLSCIVETLRLDIARKGVNQFFFIPAMLISTIDSYHFVPLSLTLTLPGGHRVSVMQNLLTSFSGTISNWSGTLFSWSEWNLMWC